MSSGDYKRWKRLGGVFSRLGDYKKGKGIQDRELEVTEAGGGLAAPEVCDVH